MSAATRALDLLGAAVALAVMAPVMGAVALMVRAHDGGPVFFRQIRIGRHGVPFRIWKFRTMIPADGRLGPEVTAVDDHRITPLGARLRRLKLDELPQLLNILAGEMSFVILPLQSALMFVFVLSFHDASHGRLHPVHLRWQP